MPTSTMPCATSGRSFEQGHRLARRQDAARDVDRSVAEAATAGVGTARRRAASCIACLPRRQRARRLHRHRPLCKPQHRLRPTFRDDRITIDLSNVTLDQALAAVSTATHNFYKVTAQRHGHGDSRHGAKRREYEEEIVRTFYLSNADLKETIDLLRIVVDARRIAPLTATNALTIKDTPERVAAAGRIIQAIDKARPEVVIDVELLEVNRTKLLEYGLQFATPGVARASTARSMSTATT